MQPASVVQKTDTNISNEIQISKWETRGTGEDESLNGFEGWVPGADHGASSDEKKKPSRQGSTVGQVPHFFPGQNGPKQGQQEPAPPLLDCACISSLGWCPGLQMIP